MKVLIVDPDAARAAGVVEAFAASDAESTVASSASFALTMLEYNRQDVIVSRSQLGDMDGRELCALVRTDPSTKSVRFVLVANDVTPAQAAEIGIDLVIPEGLIGQAIVTRVTHMLRRENESTAAAPVAATPRKPVAAPPAPPVASPPRAATPGPPTLKGAAPPPPPLTDLDAIGLNGAMRTFQGALGTLRFETLTEALANGGKTGRLLLVFPTGGGMVAFDAGRIVHAEIGSTTGEAAYQSLVAVARRQQSGKFCFIPSDPRDLANVPKTISRTVAQLLEASATALNEET
jgi:CheY-like chemotaxis protein